ncbi:MAG TPA: hypothetical protein VJL29_04710 [Thermoguttaceae bacterium]|nr:hypothetical protein [Thermoguttaceae bacterium]
MESTCLFGGRLGPVRRGRKTLSHLSLPLVRWLPAAALGLLLLAPGCANQRLPAFQRGTACSAENVQRYANTHGMTYEQALTELRRQEQQLWAEEEARQQQAAQRRGQAIPVGSGQQAAGSTQQAAGSGQGTGVGEQ